MGFLRRHPISLWREKYDLNVFVETGTYRGQGVRTALQHGFPEVYSIEINDKYYNRAIANFSNDPVVIIKGDTINEIGRLSTSIQFSNVLFWLDAHLPATSGYKQSISVNTKFPLKIELTEIAANKNISNDVFLIDDLHLHEVVKYRRSNINFIFDILSETHDIKRDIRDQGYIICLPKESYWYNQILSL